MSFYHVPGLTPSIIGILPDELRELGNFYPLLTTGIAYSGLTVAGAGYGIYFEPAEKRVFAVVRWKTIFAKCDITTFRDGYYRLYYYNLQFSFNKRNGGMDCYNGGTQGTYNVRLTTLPHAEPLPWANRITIKGYSYQTSIIYSEFHIVGLVAWRKYFTSSVINQLKTHQGMLRSGSIPERFSIHFLNFTFILF